MQSNARDSAKTFRHFTFAYLLSNRLLEYLGAAAFAIFSSSRQGWDGDLSFTHAQFPRLI